MTISFENLGLSEARVKKLQTLGFENPTEIQQKAIPLILERNDILGQSQTGTGKTASFTLPILEHLIKHKNLQKKQDKLRSSKNFISFSLVFPRLG